jgi:CRISPR-associated protein Csh2
MPVRTGEILFVKCVKNGIPNRDPLRDSDARRIFGEDDGRISLSDVSIKRDVRDYVLARFPEGGEQQDLTRLVFVQKKLADDGKTLLGRDGLANAILCKVRDAKEKGLNDASVSAKPKRKAKSGDSGADAADVVESERNLLLGAAFDMRVFGAVFSVTGKSFNQTGPVQFGWAHSMHPVETRYTQGTVVMPSKDGKEGAGSTVSDDDKGKTQGTIWTQYQLPFAVFAMPGVVNATIAGQTGMSDADVDLLLAGLWKGTVHRQARGRGLQQPLFLLHVEYTDPFFRIGFIEEGIRLNPGRDEEGRGHWTGGRPPTDVAEVILDVSGLTARLNRHSSQIARARFWVDPQLKMQGTIPAEDGIWPEGV